MKGIVSPHTMPQEDGGIRVTGARRRKIAGKIAGMSASTFSDNVTATPRSLEPDEWQHHPGHRRGIHEVTRRQISDG